MKKNLLACAIHRTGLAFSVLFLLGACSAFAGSNAKVFKLPASIGIDDYLANTIVVKVKPQFRSSINDVHISNGYVQDALNALQVSSFEKRFPHADPPPADHNAWGAKYADLTPIYEIHYASNMGIEDAINKLIRLGVFEYVEPRYIDHTQFALNDPYLSSQYAITTIKAPQAFDITQGDTLVVIGIVDSGTDPIHPDLAGNLKHNWGEIPNNGIDDDGDGYIDNFTGWDISDNDSNTTVGMQPHGVHVSGCADAVTNNGVGVASPGFKCKFMPVKSAKNTSTSSIDNGYDGIIYAANHKCDVINCSWGGSGGGQAGQDAITYATINKNALVVVAAGNNSSNGLFYPACYDYVMSVAATQQGDGLAGFSNYGSWVSICAPGDQIESTFKSGNQHGYASLSGTSMASPITAGAAAFVKSRFNLLGDTLNPLQIKAQLMATADNIDAVNGGYVGQIGAGRLNMYRAVTELTHESVNMVNITSTDNNDNTYVIGDTLRISGDITNYLAPTTNLSVTMTTTSPSYINVLSPSSLNVGAMGTMGVLNNSATPFAAVIKPGTPLNTTVTFIFTFTDGSYTSTASYSVIVNVDYLNITVNDISTSQTSHSVTAYNDPDLSTRLQGLGFFYKDSSLTYEIGFMAGTDSTHVSDDVRQGGTSSLTDHDFATTSLIKQVTPSAIADFESYGTFNDYTAPEPLHILVTHHTMAWSTPCDRKYVIVEYSIKNTGTKNLNNLYAGIFSDWDIGPSGVPDQGSVDKTLRMGYVYKNVTGGFYAGIKVLTTNAPFNHFAIDNDGTGGNGIWTGGPYASFTNAQKFQTLSTMRDVSGAGGTGDVCHTVSTGPFNNVAPGDSVVVAFALIAGDDFNDLETSANEAQLKYADPSTCALGVPVINKNTGALHVYPNPVSKTTTLNFSLAHSSVVAINIYNALGENVKQLLGSNLSAGDHIYNSDLSDLPAGTYYIRLLTGDETETQQLLIIK